MKTIAIDCRPLQDGSKTRGIGSYLRNLLKNLQNTTTINVCIFTDKSMGAIEDNFGFNNLEFSPPLIKINYTKEVIKFLHNKNIDLFHFSAQYNIFKDFNFPYTVTVHDIMNFALKDMHFGSEKDYLYELKKMKNNLGFARKIASDSNSTKEDIQKYLSIDPSKIEVIYIGKNQHPKSMSENIQGLNKPTKPYILYVGTFESRKNIERMILAFLEFNSVNKYQFVIVAAYNKTLPSNIYNLVKNRISEFIFPNYVSDQELNYLYKNAELLFFATLYEGFGLPILEAMSLNTLVITSTTSSMPEVGQDAVYYVDPYDIIAMKEGLHEMTENKETQNKLKQNYQKVLDTFSWKKCGKAMISFWESSKGL